MGLFNGVALSHNTLSQITSPALEVTATGKFTWDCILSQTWLEGLTRERELRSPVFSSCSTKISPETTEIITCDYTPFNLMHFDIDPCI